MMSNKYKLYMNVVKTIVELDGSTDSARLCVIDENGNKIFTSHIVNKVLFMTRDNCEDVLEELYMHIGVWELSYRIYDIPFNHKKFLQRLFESSVDKCVNREIAGDPICQDRIGLLMDNMFRCSGYEESIEYILDYYVLCDAKFSTIELYTSKIIPNIYYSSITDYFHNREARAFMTKILTHIYTHKSMFLYKDIVIVFSKYSNISVELLLIYRLLRLDYDKCCGALSTSACTKAILSEVKRYTCVGPADVYFTFE